MNLAPLAPSAPARTTPPPLTGAFADVALRWLVVWVIGGWLLLMGVSRLIEQAGGPTLSGELAGILFYLPILAWVVLMVVVRASVDLRAMLRWPKLGVYWLVVAGMLVVQFIFSLASILLTELIAPGLADSLEGVGQGNLILATIGLVVLPPLVEEILFRGVLIERLTVKSRVAVAVLASAVLFGILHADPVGAGVFGVITGLLYVRTGSLWPGIIIHAANNLVALTATRLAGPAPEQAQATMEATVLSAAMLLLFSVPFLVWFIHATWPRRGTLTPYQRHEQVTGLPTRTAANVTWSSAASPLHLRVTNTSATLSAPEGGVVAVLPLERVHAAYEAFVPGGARVVVILRDESWTTMQVAEGGRKPNARLAATLRERAQVAQLWAASRGTADLGSPDPIPAADQLRTR